jgi:uncharacterized protein
LSTLIAERDINIHLSKKIPNGEQLFLLIFQPATGLLVFFFEYYFCTLMLFYGKEVVMSQKKALIEIRLAGLSEGSHEFDFTVTTADFGDPALSKAGFSKDISVKVTAEKLVGEMIVTLKTVATAELICDLCLAPITTELIGSYRVYYGYEQVAESEDERDEEYRLIDGNTLSLDLTEDVRETLLLSVPMKVTCTDNPDCRVFRQADEDEPDEEGAPGIDLLESLEKLKNKYR